MLARRAAGHERGQPDTWRIFEHLSPRVGASPGLRPVVRDERPAALREVTPADERAITQADVSGRDSPRSRDALGRELLGVMAALGARELETVSTYAEFVRTRRVAR